MQPVPETTRVRLDLGYDGTDFSGWAAQPDRRTVQGELTEALRTVTRTSELAVTVAGRTDAGVHARGQVCHVDLPTPVWEALPGRSGREPGVALVARLNGTLPGDIRVAAAAAAPPAFDARFAATSRRYRYVIGDDGWRADALRRREVVRLGGLLDVAAMDQAAGRLVGLADFAAFCKRREGATTVRTLLSYGWSREDDGLVVGSVVADAFCHSMVRALVGALVPVGLGREDLGWPREVLLAGVRDPRVKVMPAHGLSLEEVTYPPAGELAARADEARNRRSLPGD
ncbi:tRNA pseudouridine(38-40) synthase TruA [Janibacter alkaliphilus]|uniref:tRNA pseudouridine synthase A n=1 Tax=Janibacter alkaliphilus TaxID=1069963 RepID=A0A852X905_9MICO|nr:tRNA pseudouridine(38-40) synthase TruA [Janibacter alkaliphilus]NYG37233.1 tRNA pseudouridine38-40 synthase [Janibacter alkaliphilus]